MSPRAPALSRNDRRAAIIAATVPLLREHGRAVTTRQIAEPIRPPSEVLPAIPRAFDRAAVLARLAEIDRSLPLRQRLIAYVTVLQVSFIEIFDLMAALGFVAPPQPPSPDRKAAWREAVREATAGLVDQDADGIGVDPETLWRYLRLLTFSGSHPDIADGRVLPPDEIVDLVMLGVLRTDARDLTLRPHPEEA